MKNTEGLRVTALPSKSNWLCDRSYHCLCGIPELTSYFANQLFDRATCSDLCVKSKHVRPGARSSLSLDSNIWPSWMFENTHIVGTYSSYIPISEPEHCSSL